MKLSEEQSISCDRALIFDIQDFSVQDGPGIRTTIFFKGCPLKCIFCSNPEGQNIHPELFYVLALCKKSHRCITTCPYNAVTKGDDGYPDFRRKICRNCSTKDCVSTCYQDALRTTGYFISIDEIIERVKPNIQFYKNSSGGITLSGGEPFLQNEFVSNLLNRCSEEGISAGVETCGYFDWDDAALFINKFEFIYYDLKAFTDDIHNKATGRSNQIILSNLKKLSEKNSEKIIVSIPVIPGLNDNEFEIKLIADYCNKLNINKIRLLPYHDYGREKYTALGMTYPMESAYEITSENLQILKNVISEYGIECWIE